MPVIDTAELRVLNKRPGWRGRIVHSKNMTFAYWEFDAGSDIHEHHHVQEEVWHIVEGSVEITIGNERHVAGPGMVAIVPANERHSVKAITAGKVIVADF